VVDPSRGGLIALVVGGGTRSLSCDSAGQQIHERAAYETGEISTALSAIRGRLPPFRCGESRQIVVGSFDPHAWGTDKRSGGRLRWAINPPLRIAQKHREVVTGRGVSVLLTTRKN